MKKEKCNCDEHCDCGCQDGKECTCHECDCGVELPPLEEKLILVGKKDNKKTEEAIKYLDKKGADYKFLDLEEEKELLLDLDGIDIPSLLLVQTIVSGIAPGLDGIKDAFGD